MVLGYFFCHFYPNKGLDAKGKTAITIKFEGKNIFYKPRMRQLKNFLKIFRLFFVIVNLHFFVVLFALISIMVKRWYLFTIISIFIYIFYDVTLALKEINYLPKHCII